MDVTIGRCTAGEIDDVIRFIQQHWKPGHALTRRPLIDWQHRDVDGSGYNIILARRRRDAAITGMLGYIPTKRFDERLAADNVLWLTTWKVRDDAGVAGLGIQLLDYLVSHESHVAIGAVGLTPSTVPIYKAFGYRVGELQHYVRMNPTFTTFRLVAQPPRATSPASSTSSTGALPLEVRRLVRDDDFDTLGPVNGPAIVPVKTAQYFRRRYLHHPIYRYTIAALVDSADGVALLAARVADWQGRRAVRLVDFAGSPELFTRTRPLVDELMTEFDAEYADIYNAGIADEVFERAGFSRIDPDGPTIVPDHFEPLERRNVRLWFALKSKTASTALVFKGDADQDRPNIVSVGR